MATGAASAVFPATSLPAAATTTFVALGKAGSHRLPWATLGTWPLLARRTRAGQLEFPPERLTLFSPSTP